MIVCPICGRATAVTETRSTGGGTRRRRKCVDATCTGRMTTVEVVVDRLHGPSASELTDGHAVIVSRRTIARLQRVVASLGGTSS